MEEKKSQKQVVLEHLTNHGNLSALEASNWYGIGRLSARINELRSDGYNIITNGVTSKNRYGNSVTYARYTLAENNLGGA